MECNEHTYCKNFSIGMIIRLCIYIFLIWEFKSLYISYLVTLGKVSRDCALSDSILEENNQVLKNGCNTITTSSKECHCGWFSVPRVHISLAQIRAISRAVITFVTAPAPRSDGQPNHPLLLSQDTQLSRTLKP